MEQTGPAASPLKIRIDYVEIACKDIAATKAFYGAAFGWEFTDYGPEYTSFTDGRLWGGFRTDLRLGPANGSCLIVLYAADLEAAEGKVRSAGGRVFNPHSFPGGRRFHFHDPSGNELAVWSDGAPGAASA